MDIYVSNLPFKIKEKTLQELFEVHGEVISTKIIIDKITRQNKGFGFVEMANDDEAKAAIKALNGFEIMERKLVVNRSQVKLKTEVTKKPVRRFLGLGKKWGESRKGNK